MEAVPFVIESAVSILFIILAILNRKAFKGYYKIGLVIGIVIFLMRMPILSYAIAHYYSRALGTDSPFFVGLIACGVIWVLSIGWYMVAYYVSVVEWDKVRASAFTLLRNGKNAPWGVIIFSALLGVVLAEASYILFLTLHVKESEFLGEMMKNSPEFVGLCNPFIASLLVSIAAIVEELFYRGALFAFLLRKSKNTILTVLFVSFLWAILHIINTNMPLVKFSQTFIIGIIFCELARRSCIESSIAAHLGVNLGAVAIGFIFGV